jgi:hypothetical protein
MTERSKPTRLHLVPDPRPAPPGPDRIPIRRYRIARLRFEPRPPSGEGRFAHLERVFD